MSDREIAYWECDEDAETLRFEDRDEAIGNYLGDRIESRKELEEFISKNGETLEVYGYAQQVAKLDPEWVLEQVLEELDSVQMLGDPNGAPDPTPAMLEAAKAFCAVVLAEYVPWACDRVVTETVNVRKWVEVNNPDWLEE